MTLRVNIDDGGTNAGRRTVREQSTERWACAQCNESNPHYATRCLTTGCNLKRP